MANIQLKEMIEEFIKPLEDTAETIIDLAIEGDLNTANHLAAAEIKITEAVELLRKAAALC